MTNQNTIIDINRYTIISKIGEGVFSKVYRVKDISTGKYYAAKISKKIIDEDTKDTQDAHQFFRETNLMSFFNHLSVLQFVGYYLTNFDDEPYPMIITELVTNGSLHEVINLEINGLSPDDWNSTKKLIVIYGIAAGMLFLHAHGILHRDLKPENILMDDCLHPKISDFGLSKSSDFLSDSMNFKSQNGLKGTPCYMAPESILKEIYTKAGDVYAFGLIVFEIMTVEIPFQGFTIGKLIQKVAKEGFRPEIKEDVPKAYRSLIERCWSQIPEERPTFENIVDELKSNSEFITKDIDETKFFDYVDKIDEYPSKFDVNNRAFRSESFFNSQEQNSENTSELIDKKLSNQDMIKETTKTNLESEKVQNKSPIKIKNNEEATDLIFPLLEFEKLSKENQTLVLEAVKNGEKQYEVGKSLILGNNNFSQNIKLGLEYIKQSVSNKCINGTVYYTKLLIKGKIIPQDLNKAIEYLRDIQKTDDKRIFLMKGLISYRQNKFKEAVKSFYEGTKIGCVESMYQYGKMLFLGEGIKRNLKESFKYFNLSKNEGFKKSEYFLSSFDTFKNIKEFSELPSETQLILINNSIKYQYQQNETEFNKIVLQPQKTEKLFYNKSLKTNKFLKVLSKYQNISIEIANHSSSFRSLLNHALKIQNKNIRHIKIGIVFTSFAESIDKKCFSKDISYYKIDISVNTIPSNAFKEFMSLTTISIPSSVTSIESYAFEKCSSLTEISIPPSVASIKSYAFAECTSLKQISIPSSVSSFGNNVFLGISSLNITGDINEIPNEFFKNCTSLTQISIPSSVISIGSDAFSECNSLSSIEIPSFVTSIKINTFSGCTSLKQISIPSSVVSIGGSAFFGCISLVQISIPSSVTSIGSYAFAECSSLTKISVPSSVTTIGSYVFKECKSLAQISLSSVVSITSYAFSGCNSLKQISIPSSVTLIGSYAFERCTSLVEMSIPSSVTLIGLGAFSGCISLKQISIPSSVSSFEGDIFAGIKSLNITGDINHIPGILFKYCTSLEQISIPSSVTSIGSDAFFGCYSLTKISIPSSVTSFGKNIFSGVLALNITGDIKFIPSEFLNNCESLRKVSIPSSVTSIGSNAFSNCLSLIKVSIPSSVTSIGSDAFFGCNSLAKISIPSSVISIGDYAFADCFSLTEISIPSSVTSFGKNIFSGIKSLQITGDLKYIPNGLFKKCTSLTQITIPLSVTSIESYAFSGCTSLTQITIPSSITSIGSHSFDSCSSLNQISIPSSVTLIGSYAFYKCESLTQVTIPSSITSISSYIFAECKSLKQFSIPSSVTSIGSFAFDKCSSLAQIHIPSSVTSIGENVFSECRSLKEISIPSSVTSIGENTFDECSSLTHVIIPSNLIKQVEFGRNVEVEQT